MFPYVIVSFILALLAIIDGGKKRKSLFVVAYIIVTLLAGFRGDFTSDYSGYCELFVQANSYNSLQDLLLSSFYTEKGFMVFMFVFGRIWNSTTAFIFFMSAVTNYLFFYALYKKSKFPLFSVILYVGVGTYYDSFNISRFILLTAFVFAFSDWIANRKLLKYLIFILLVLNIHSMAILMIPLYFLLNIKINSKNILLQVLIGGSVLLFFPKFIDIMVMVFPKYQNYVFGMEGGTWKTIVVPGAVMLFMVYYLCLNKNTDFDVKNSYNKLMINALIYQIIFVFCSMYIYMATRLIFFVSPFMWVLLPNLICSIKNKKERGLWFITVAFFALIYPFFVYSNTGYDPYFTIFG